MEDRLQVQKVGMVEVNLGGGGDENDLCVWGLGGGYLVEGHKELMCMDMDTHACDGYAWTCGGMHDGHMGCIWGWLDMDVT